MTLARAPQSRSPFFGKLPPEWSAGPSHERARGDWESPIGLLRIVVGPHGVLALALPGYAIDESVPKAERDPRVRLVREQLREYFAGKRRRFELPLSPDGTDFELRIWAAVAAIPYGQTASYAEVAERAGSAGSFRATGAANGRNPLPLLVPCHRVVGSGGRLTGYGGGLSLKAKLLKLEGLAFDRDETSASTRVVVEARAGRGGRSRGASA